MTVREVVLGRRRESPHRRRDSIRPLEHRARRPTDRLGPRHRPCRPHDDPGARRLGDQRGGRRPSPRPSTRRTPATRTPPTRSGEVTGVDGAEGVDGDHGGTNAHAAAATDSRLDHDQPTASPSPATHTRRNKQRSVVDPSDASTWTRSRCAGCQGIDDVQQRTAGGLTYRSATKRRCGRTRPPRGAKNAPYRRSTKTLGTRSGSASLKSVGLSSRDFRCWGWVCGRVEVEPVRCRVRGWVFAGLVFVAVVRSTVSRLLVMCERHALWGAQPSLRPAPDLVGWGHGAVGPRPVAGLNHIVGCPSGGSRCQYRARSQLTASARVTQLLLSGARCRGIEPSDPAARRRQACKRLAGRRDTTLVDSAPLTDTDIDVMDRWNRVVPRHRLNSRPPHQARALFGDRTPMRLQRPIHGGVGSSRPTTRSGGRRRTGSRHQSPRRRSPRTPDRRRGSVGSSHSPDGP